MHSRRPWPVDVIDYRRARRAWDLLADRRQVSRRARTRRARPSVRSVRRSLLVARAFGRVHAALVGAVWRSRRTSSTAARPARWPRLPKPPRGAGMPYALDLEDFHSGESSARSRRASTRSRRASSGTVLPRRRVPDHSSEAIAAGVPRAVRRGAAVIHNTFPLPAQPPDCHARRSRLLPPRTGSARPSGRAAGSRTRSPRWAAFGVTAELVAARSPHDGYLDALRALAAAHAPQRRRRSPCRPASPDAMIDLARGYDVGLALEQATPLNRQLCLTNKAFTYILAGVAVAMTDTPGQHALGVDLGRGAAAACRPATSTRWPAAFARWAADPGGARLREARPRGRPRRGAGTGSTTPERGALLATRPRGAVVKVLLRDGSVHQGAARRTTAASSASSPTSPTASRSADTT